MVRELLTGRKDAKQDEKPLLGLTVERPNSGCDPCSAELLEITGGEAKIVANSVLSFMESVTLRIPIGEREIVAAGRVHWVAPLDDDRWFVWCKLERKLSNEAQQMLAGASQLERRRSPRLPADVAATARWELAPDWFHVRIRDVSAGGCCLLSPSAGEIGRRLVVRPEGMHGAMLATVQWQKETEGGYRIGCRVFSLLR